MGTHRKSDSAARKAKWQRQFSHTEQNKARHYKKMTEQWVKAHPDQENNVPDWTAKPDFTPKPKKVFLSKKERKQKEFILNLYKGKENLTKEQIKRVRAAGFTWNPKTRTISEAQGGEF